MAFATQPETELPSKLLEQVTNGEGTGLVDKINAGEYKLSFEVDKTDKAGNINEVTSTGSMYCVETWGEWTGRLYDKVQLICTTGGVYGTAEITAKTYGSDKLFGHEKTGIKVTGELQEICYGLYVRFEGTTLAVNDRWDIEVRRHDMKETNTNVRTITAFRNNRYLRTRK